MNRLWKTWLTFVLCSAVVLAVMTWVSRAVLRLERAQADAQAQAELEEKVRLALWRMDSMLAPLIAQESARPHSAYTAFAAAQHAYGKLYNPISSGEVLVPSPLLTQVASNILLHFQLDGLGRLTSPQVPSGNQRDLAEAQFTTHQQIETAAARLRELETILRRDAPPELARYLSPVLPSSNAMADSSFWHNKSLQNSIAPAQTQSIIPQQQKEAPDRQAAQARQIARNDQELGARAQSVQNVLDLNFKNTFAGSIPAGASSLEDLLKPVWLGNTLVLVRRVTVQEQDYVQGCWVDWTVTRGWLLESIRDLLPDATLEPLKNNGEDPQARMLATLPVRVLPAPTDASPGRLASPMMFALGLAWACVLVAGVAVGLLLQGTLSLSERRAAFVSAVTHELRTPLTTFKMYSEMLAGGMVPEPKRREYLSRLCGEADRLHHLVENVLAYARLERGSTRNRAEKVALCELIQRVKPRLLQRAAQSGLSLQEDAHPDALATLVHVDVSAVEQILFNLVDNACKYGAPSATEKTIHLEALPENSRFTLLRVRDHGQGISSEAAKRLFQPFSKSAQEAASTAPGVGLGLALCRRLGRSLGGELRLNSSITGGACFELLLPAAQR